MTTRPMLNRCGICGAEWWDAHVCPKQALKDGRSLEDWLKDQPKTAPEVAAAFVRAMVDGDGWPKLTKPARVGNGTFGVGVSARLVVEAAQRQHEYHAEDAALTPDQAREHERKRREAWDMLNGPLEVALAQPTCKDGLQVEPQGCDHCKHPLHCAIKCSVCGRVTEPVQEPVAWIYQNSNTDREYLVWRKSEGGRNWRSLYTAPQQRLPLTVERLRDALVASRIVSPAAVEDPDGYDDGVTLHRIEALHGRLT